MEINEYQIKIKQMRRQLLIWSEGNLRQYPWRKTRNVYDVLIAEIMLHRTRADQVEHIYSSFIRKYPDIQSIANEEKKKLIDELRPLGLIWRADLLYELAMIVVRDNSGKIPEQKKRLMELPGIGHYIASAVLCLAKNQQEPMVDTNTVRVIGRVFGIPVTDSSRRSKKFHSIMRDLVDFNSPRLFSLAMIDLAASVCIHGKTPLCGVCPISSVCDYDNSKRND